MSPSEQKKRRSPNPAPLDKSLLHGLAGAASETVDRYGSGVHEILKGYDGVSGDGTTLKRSLESIAHSKRADATSPLHYQQTKAQAGFSAEVKETTRRNAEEAIAGKRPHVVRTDDIPGHVNDQFFDVAEVDSMGNPIPGSGYQMKFVGSSPKAAVQKMMGTSYQKYLDHDVSIAVPKDYYDGMQQELSEKTSSLEQQIKQLKKQGNPTALEHKQQELNKCRRLAKNLRPSNTTNAEALEARNHPLLSTVKDTASIAHRAGLEQAKAGACIGGVISFSKNAIEVLRGEKELKDAARDIGTDVIKTAGVSYAVGATGTVLKGTMQKAGSSALRCISKSNLPAYIVTATIEIGKTLKDYMAGTINGEQCLEQLGEKGYNMVNSSLYAAIGQAVIPVPVIGALAGGMIGYAISSASYNALLQSLKNARLAREERIRIEKECEEAIAMMKDYQKELQATIEQHLQTNQRCFDTLFARMQEAMTTGNTDAFLQASNTMTEAFGGTPLFRTKQDFEDMMLSDEPIVL